MSFVNYCVLAISFLVPALLLCKKKHDYLIFWIGLTLIIEIFNSLSLISITATKMTGLVLLPYAIQNFSKIYATRPGKILTGLTCFFVTLGILYGFVFPWPDVTGVRSIRYLSQGRSVLYLGTYFLELIVVVYLGTQLRKKENFHALYMGLVFGSILSGFGLILEKFCHFDFFYYFTGWDPRPLSIRPRGFNYEPRGAGYSTAVGLLMLLLPFLKFDLKTRALFMLVVYYGFHLAASVSGIFLMIVGIPTLIYFFWSFRKLYTEDYRLFLKSLQILGLIIFAFNMRYIPLPTFQWYKKGGDQTVRQRQTAWEYSIESKKVEYVDSEGWMSKFEPFDSATLAFFADHPAQLLIGTGPGLISLPASYYRTIDSLPHIGLLLQISNYGLVGLFLWFTMILAMFKNLLRCDLTDLDNRNKLALFIFLIPLYSLQAKVIYIIALGLGFASYFQMDAQLTTKIHPSSDLIPDHSPELGWISTEKLGLGYRSTSPKVSIPL